MQREGIRDVAVCGNRETRRLQSQLARHVPLGLTVSYHEDPMPRGAAGSARDAASVTDADTFVVADGTLIPHVILSDLLQRHHASDACVTVVVHPGVSRSGNPAQHEPSGIYVFSRRALDTVPARGFCDIKEELIPRLYAAGECIVAYETAAVMPRVLDFSTYMAVNEWMVEKVVKNGNDRDGYVRVSDALVHREAFVADDAAIIGPVLVGPGARILSSAVVVGPTSIGREATIECGGLVSRSAVWRRSIVGEQATADQCVVTDDAVIKAGAQTFQDIVTADRELDVETVWAGARSYRGSREPALGVGPRLGRFVFGAGWSRSAAAQ